MNLAKIPPQNLEAEATVLGSILIENSCFATVATIISEDDFYREAHRKIFRAVSELVNRGDPVEIVSLSDYLAARGELESIGGSAYIASLVDQTATAANVSYYSNLLREKAARRRILAVTTDFQERTSEGPESSFDIAAGLSSSMVDLIAKYMNRRQAFVKFEEIVIPMLKQLEGGRSMEQIKTGFYDLDDKIGGIAIGDLWIIAGRPGMGKSSFVASIAMNVAKTYPVAFVSIETTKEQVLRRMLSALSDVDNFRLKSGQLRDGDIPKVVAATAIASELKIYAFDSDRSWDKIRAEIELLKQREPELRLVIIDYIGLLSAPVPRGERYLEVGRISSEAKSMATRIGIGCIICSQLNRGVEDRPDRSPRLSDLRESGNLEQDADGVLMLYRKAYYEKEVDQGQDQEVIVGIAKNRDGLTGNISLLFRPRTVSFLNMEGQR